jgi:hypothetical protein
MVPGQAAPHSVPGSPSMHPKNKDIQWSTNACNVLMRANTKHGLYQV